MSRVSREGHVVGNYAIGRLLGEGGSGVVYLATNIATGEKVAMKIIDKGTMTRDMQASLHREIRIMQLLDHPNIVKLYEVIETTACLHLILECCPNGEVFDYVVQNTFLSEKEMRPLFRQLVSAMQYCHSLKVVHRDLKLENLLIGNDREIRISDFGLGNMINGTMTSPQLLHTLCGTPNYAPPELLDAASAGYDGYKSDVWSMGVVLFACLYGTLPFDNEEREVLYNMIRQQDIFYEETITADAISLLRSMLTRDPRARISMKDIMTHPWVTADGLGPLIPYASKTPEVKAENTSKKRLRAYSTRGRVEAVGHGAVTSVPYDHRDLSHEDRAALIATLSCSDPFEAMSDTTGSMTPSEYVRAASEASSSTTRSPSHQTAKTAPAEIMHTPPLPTSATGTPSLERAAGPSAGTHSQPSSATGTPQSATVGTSTPPTGQLRRMSVSFPLSNDEVEVFVTENPDFAAAEATTSSGGTPVAGPLPRRRSSVDVGSVARRAEDAEEEDDDGPRVARIHLTRDTASAMPAAEVFVKVGAALQRIGLTVVPVKWTFVCAHAAGVRFEVEIVRIPNMQVHGVRFKRLAGNLWLYKELRPLMIKSFGLGFDGSLEERPAGLSPVLDALPEGDETVELDGTASILR